MEKKVLTPAILLLAAATGLYAFNKSSKKPKSKLGQPVKPFDIEKYLGKWYEIARMDFVYERNLNNTTAEYSKRIDGKVKVVNRGYNTETGEWDESVGKARFVGDTDTAMLEVSFFGPFYGGYNVISIDNDYTYALVTGDSLDYMWILSRETTIPELIKIKYLAMAKSLGYKVDELVWPAHDMADARTK